MHVVRAVVVPVVMLLGCGGGRAPRPAAPPTPSAPAPPPAPSTASDVRVAVRPSPAYVELTDAGQALSCDLVITNSGTSARTLVRLQVTALDRGGAVVYRRFVDGNGVRPAIEAVPDRAIAAGATTLLFNPLPWFPRDVELAVVRFDLDLEDAAGGLVTASADVTPTVYRDVARLRLPLAGPLVVWDGHDLLAHHRRWDYLFAPIAALGFTTNAGRYSYDLVPVDATGAMAHGDEADNASWLGFRAPVRAPADGTVAVAVDRHADDRTFDMDALPGDLMLIYGNHVVIDHGHGEFSLLAHLARGSVTVHVGDRVRAGQAIAAIGASGSALFPHLHYQLQTRPDATAEGLPSYFHAFVRRRGARMVPVAAGQIDSGELVESTAP